MEGERARGHAVARIRHRVGQGLGVVLAPLLSLDPDEVEGCLRGTPDAAALRQLFLRMPRAEQHHGLGVCHRLRDLEIASPDVLAAALLHDVGKIRCPPRLWEKVAVVLLEHAVPGIGRWMGWLSAVYPCATLLRRAFRVRQCHACWGARLAARAGASPRTATLIRYHHISAKRDDVELLALQVADEA